MHVPGVGGRAGGRRMLLGAGSGGLRVGGGQVFVLEILHDLLGQLRQHGFGQGFFRCLQGGVGLREERAGY